jgi:hypothetical protein
MSETFIDVTPVEETTAAPRPAALPYLAVADARAALDWSGRGRRTSAAAARNVSAVSSSATSTRPVRRSR